MVARWSSDGPFLNNKEGFPFCAALVLTKALREWEKHMSVFKEYGVMCVEPWPTPDIKIIVPERKLPPLPCGRGGCLWDYMPPSPEPGGRDLRRETVTPEPPKETSP